jgi:hypothetical protein
MWGARGKGGLYQRELASIVDAIKDHDLVSRPEELRSLVDSLAQGQREERLRKIRSQRQNQPLGIALLTAGTAVAVAGVLLVFWLATCAGFGVFAKVTFLVCGLAGALLVSVEDPFHDDLGEDSTPIERLKLQGKILVITTLTAVLCTGLNLYTEHEEHCQDQLLLALRIDIASIKTVARLEQVRLLSEQLEAELEALNKAVGHGVLDTLKQIAAATDRIATLPTRRELLTRTELDHKLSTLATSESVQRLATTDRVNRLATSLQALATADSVNRVATQVSTLATADSVSRLASADAVNRLAASMGTLATAESVSRLATYMRSLASADSVETLATRVAGLSASMGNLATLQSVSRLATQDAVDALTTSVTRPANASSKADVPAATAAASMK